MVWAFVLSLKSGARDKGEDPLLRALHPGIRERLATAAGLVLVSRLSMTYEAPALWSLGNAEWSLFWGRLGMADTHEDTVFWFN